MNKKILLSLLMLASLAPKLFSQDYEVSNSELESVLPIEFTSYVGPHESIDSLADIIAIGTSLSQNLDAEGRSSYSGKYSVQRILSGESTQSLGADILSLSESAEVDHIRNLRHIISGYLQAQYAYEAEAADTISTYITYYNAFYRSDIAYFQQKYSPAVQASLDPQQLGLSTNYAEWPGNTQIIIPLSAYSALGQAPGPNLDETGQRSISQYLAENEPETARQTRENMLELRQDKLKDDQGTLEGTQGNLEAENRTTQEALQESAAREDAAQSEGERLAARQQQEELQQGLQDNQQEQNEVDSVQQTIAQRQENLNKERRELQEQQAATPPQNELSENFQIELLPAKNGFFQFYAIDGETLSTVKRSELNSIRSADFVANDLGYIVVAGEHNITQLPLNDTDNKRRIRLVQLEKNFGFVRQGSHNIHPESGVWEIEGNLYAYLVDGSLARFNQNLELEAQTHKTYIPKLRPRLIGTYILVQEKKEFRLLNPFTLNDKYSLQ